MLDSFLVPDDDTSRSAQKLFIAAFGFTLFAIWFAYHIMPLRIEATNINGLMAVIFATIALLYPITQFIQSRDKSEIATSWPETRLIDRHFHESLYYLAAFTGVTLGFAAAIQVVPATFFAVQASLVDQISVAVGQMTSTGSFSSFLTLNAGVFIGTFALSFFLTGGLVFILVLNASNLGYVIGTSAQSIFQIPIETLPYIAHGTLEIGAYIAAGLAGMLLSYSVEQALKEEIDLSIPIKDAAVLLAIGCMLLVIAAAIESGTDPITGLMMTAQEIL